MSDHDIFRFLREAVKEDPVAMAYIDTIADELSIRRHELENTVWPEGLIGVADHNVAWTEFRQAEMEQFHKVAKTLLARNSGDGD